jgi:signal transduction histidine kinase/CheY-like chemotaxis protein
MTAQLAKAIAALDRLVNYFIPPDIAADRDTRNRAHVFLVSHILGPFIGSVVPISIYVLDPVPGYDVAVLAASIAAFWIFPFVLRAGVPYNPLALVSIENLIFCILWSCYFYGGVTSPTLAWVLVIPLLAFFYLGSSSTLRLIVMTMFAVNVTIFSVFYLLGFHVNNSLPVAAMQGLGLVSTTAAALYVTMMALYYAKVLASQSELEGEMRQHMTTAAALRAATEEAERAGAAKAEFLARMSHELRTPLNAVLGFSDLLAEERHGSLNDRQRRYVSHIHTGGTHLLKLISDILDLSKIEAGRLEIVCEDVSIASAFAEVLSALQPLAEKKSQTLLQRVEPNLHVRADCTRFKQILMNLIGNAIKFTPEAGRIELAARQVGEQVRLEVRDNGSGIALEEQQRIFEAFYRLAQKGSSTEGTGLGLAITRRLVELHGSKLQIESKPGEGTCFYFSLPLLAIAPSEAAQTAVATLRAGKVPRILVVEDNAATGQLIQSQLTSSGYETLRCDQPERAAEMAAEHQPDAITLDLLMHPINGLELLLQLKNDPRTLKIPVIVVTIVDQPGVGTALGADEYLVKPVDKATLLAAVERCLRSRGGAAPTRAILVVEDDASTREMIEELLAARGYQVITAVDGAQARARVAHALPELVILDLVLPKMSGLELLAEWRGSPRTADLPVFVLTSKDLTKEEEKYIRAHAESLFRKQNSWREPLMRQLERIISPQVLEDA